MLNIKEILGEDYLKKFRVYHPVILFEPNWEALKKYSCPICGNKLKFARDKEIGYCRSIKHKNPFIISNKRFMKLFSGK